MNAIWEAYQIMLFFLKKINDLIWGSLKCNINDTLTLINIYICMKGNGLVYYMDDCRL